MAEDALGKTVKQLKRERTTAKSSFTRQANFISRGVSSMLEAELKEEFIKLSHCFRQLLDANDDCRIGLLAEIKKPEEEEEEEEVVLEKQQERDIKRTENEAETKFEEVKDTVQTNLWSRYGKNELEMAILEAENAFDQANGVVVESTNVECYEVHLTLLLKRLKELTPVMSAWERWIPALSKDELDNRVKNLRTASNRLEHRKAEFVTARRIAEQTLAAEASGAGRGRALPTPATPIVKIKPTTLPIFNGCKREYHRWRKDWESLQRQGEPTGSPEVKKIQLLGSVEDKISKNLRLSTYNTAEDIFRVMENRYGNKSTIAIEILEELEKMPHVRGNQPRKVIDLIQSVERALADLTELGNSGAMNNPLVIKSIESKLPDFILRDWLKFMVDPANDVTSDNHFGMLLKFLKKQEEILERLEQLRTVEKMEKSDHPENRYERKYASTRTTEKGELEDVCGVCGDSGHKNKIFFCRKFKWLKLPEKRSVLEKLGACIKCLGCHDDDGYCRDTFLCRNKDCKEGGGTPDHHYFLCPKGELKRGEVEKSGKGSRGKSKLTEEQEGFLSELSPELAERCKRAFTNKTTVTNNAKVQSELLEKKGLSELPVIMMLMKVTANAGQKIGTLVDLASDTNYITHKAADRLRLQSEKITLVVHGVGGMTMKVNTKRYVLKVRVKTPRGTERAHELVCYGLDEIAKVQKVIEPEMLQKFFPEVELEELRRPEEVELLISHREGRLAPQRVRVVGDLVLWESPLGKTVGGAHPDLFEEVQVAAHESKTHFARSMRTAAVKYEEILRSSTTEAAQLQQKWKGPEWYVSHLVAPNPHSTQPAGEAGKKKMKDGNDFLKQEVRPETPNPLTRRGLLSQVAGLYDPVGLVTPAKQKGAILVRKAFQEGGGGKLTTWQNGPDLLKWPVDKWPKKSAGEVAANARESVNKLQRKAFTAVVTRAQAKIVQKKENPQTLQESLRSEIPEERTASNPSPPLPKRKPAGWVIKNLLEVRNFSRLSKLVKVIGWVGRAAHKWREKKGQTRGPSKWEAMSLKKRTKGVAGTLLRTRKKAWVSDFTTMDLFGPYEVKKRVRRKVWGIVFCCMASRAIHTDVVSDQSSEGFPLAYQRFTSPRGFTQETVFRPWH